VALSDLIARLERDADGQIEAITRRADAEVLATRASVARDDAAATAVDLRRRRDERQSVHDRELVRARRLAHQHTLEAQHALVSRVLDRARVQTQAAANHALYLAALPAYLSEAVSHLEGLPVRVRCAPAAAAALAPVVAGRPEIELVEDQASGPGLLVETIDGSVVIDNTLAARLSRLERRLAIRLIAEVCHARR